MKFWDGYVESICTYVTIFGKEKIETRLNPFKIYTEAETEEEAIQKIKKEYDELQKASETNWRCNKVVDLRNWDDWTIEEAMRRLTAKQFAEYAKQNNITSLFR